MQLGGSIHLQESFRKEINAMVEMDIIKKVTEHTDWVNSHVIVEKDAKVDSSNAHAPNHSVIKNLRICLDPRDLNKALEREPYFTRSVDEITVKFKGMAVFTIVDSRRATGWWYYTQTPGN